MRGVRGNRHHGSSVEQGLRPGGHLGDGSGDGGHRRCRAVERPAEHCRGQPRQRQHPVQCDAPLWWGTISAYVEGHTWPNGHQDKLCAAADAWTGAGSILRDAASHIPAVVSLVQQQQSPEVPGAVTACEGLSRNMMTVADEFAVLGKACADYAGNIDEAHSKVLHELVTLGWQTGAIEGIAAVAAFSTFGGSEVAGQLVEAERLAVIGARIAGVLGAATDAATLSAAPTIPAVASFGQVVDELGPLLEARATLYGSEAPGVIPALGEVAKDVAARRVKLRVGVKQAVRDEAKKTPAGDFIDPYSDQIIPKEGPFDYGHKEGVEWWRTQEQARREGWTRQQLLDFENIPEHYQIQNWA